MTKFEVSAAPLRHIFGKKNISVLLSLFFLAWPAYGSFSPGRSGEESPASGDIPQSRRPLVKSLLVPGWGQLAEKKYLEGFLFLGGEVFCFYQALKANSKGNSSYRLYKDAGGVEDALRYRGLTEKYDARRNKYLLAAAGIWALNLLDIYLIVRNKETANREKGLRVNLETGIGETLALAVRCSF